MPDMEHGKCELCDKPIKRVVRYTARRVAKTTEHGVYSDVDCHGQPTIVLNHLNRFARKVQPAMRFCWRCGIGSHNDKQD